MLRFTARTTLLTLLLSLLSGCAADAWTLDIRVVTGLVPGPEFRYVQTTVLERAGTRVLFESEAVARFDMDYAGGQGTARYRLPSGEYLVRVRLMRPNGVLLIERSVALSLVNDTVLPVHLTRDCVGVQCPSPGGSPEFSSCLAGRCVDPRCSATNNAYCPTIVFCHASSECRATAECAEMQCDEGVCIETGVANACESDEWCNPDLGAGCQPTMRSTPDSGVACGTICTQADAPCSFGYWNCDDLSSPRCESLQQRPSDAVCADGRVCDTNGECVVPEIVEPGIVVTPTTGLVTSETGLSASFRLVLTTQPTESVFILASSSDTSEGTISPTVTAFTPLNWAIPQTVTVTGVDDVASDGAQAYTIILAAAVSGDANYSGLDASDVSVINRDDESAGILLSRTNDLRTREDGVSDSFTVTLDRAPSADVVLSLSVDDPSEVTVSPPELRFTATDYAVPQTVTVTGVDDSVRDGAQPFTVITSSLASEDVEYDGLAVADLTGSNEDDETPRLLVSPTSGLVTGEDGRSDTFTLVLSSAPSSNVSLSLSSSLPTEASVAPASLVFTSSNWSTPRTFTVTGVDDASADGDRPFTIVTSTTVSADSAFQGLVVDDVTGVNQDDDIAGLRVTPSSITTSENGSGAMLSVRLSSRPTATVNIVVASTNASEGTVSPAVLAFTPANWDTARTVIVTGVDDPDLDGDIAYDIDVSIDSTSDVLYAALPSQHVHATNTDNDSAGIVLWPMSNPLQVRERSGTASFRVTAQTRPRADLVIPISSSDISEGVTDVSSITINASNWNTGPTVTVTGVIDNIDDGTSSYTIQLGTVVSADTDYNGIDPSDIAANTYSDCAPDQVSCSGVCATCPTGPQVGTTACSGTACVATSCLNGYSLGNDNCNGQPLVAPNGEPSDYFGGWGAGIALSGDASTLAIGAAYEDSNATGVNGDGSDNSASESGAAYVFRRAGDTWNMEAYVKASNTNGGDYFGTALAISDDGNTLAVGSVLEASTASGINGDQLNNGGGSIGAVYVYTRSGSTWTQQAYLKASNPDNNDRFGMYVAMSADGNVLAVGAPVESSNAIGINGNQFNNSTANAGAVYIFRRTGSMWAQEAYAKQSRANAGYLGYGLAVSDDGSTIAAGARAEGSSAVGINGDPSVLGRPDSGAVYVYRYNGSMWTTEAYVKASNPDMYDAFGYSIALSSNGNAMVVSAINEASNALGVGGNELDNSAGEVGAIYSFARSGATWTQNGYLKPLTVSGPQHFGIAVALTSNGNELYAVSEYGVLSRFHYNGSTWTTARSYSTGGGRSYSYVCSVSNDGGWLAAGSDLSAETVYAFSVTP